MNTLNIVFDGRVLKWGLSNGTRSGIYFVAQNIIQMLEKRSNLGLYLPKSDLPIANKLITLLNLNSVSVFSDDDDFSSINAFFSPVFACPDFIKKYPNVSCYTILYDIIPLLFSEYYNNCDNVWFNRLIKSLNSQEYYFAISEYTKKDFLKYCSQLDANKMVTIPLSTNLPYKPNKGLTAAIKEKYNIPADKKYLFSLCSLEPRKNLIRAVKAFIQFIEKNKINDLVYVLGGGAWQGFIEKLEKEIPDFAKYQDKIIRAGYVADEDLEVLYSNAEWFVYTSQYEGFGMPPLEAMACGTAVITSNNSSLPEVVGDAGIMIDYDSEEQHVAAYEKYYFDKKFRDKMAKKGLERSKQFSWSAAVDVILNKMQEVEAKKANQPLVTVITPTFNLIKGGRKETFIQSAESVQKQTYKNIEHIVIDGASEDGTLKLLEKYQKKGWFKYYSEPDKGIYDAMNKGILKARGKYVVCLNSDDFYCNDNAIEMLVQKAEEQDADACYGNALRVNPETLKFICDWRGNEHFEPWRSLWPCHQTFLIKTEVMKELGLYDIQYEVSADNNFFMRLIQCNKKIIGIDVNIINFRDGGFSNDHLDIAVKEQINGLYREYGQYHGLTPLDCSYLHNCNYINLPLEQAIALGSKLEKAEWRDEYFKHLFNNYDLCGGAQCHNTPATKTIYKLFGFLPLLKIRKDLDAMKISLFGFLPLYGHKKVGGREQWKLFGLPIFKIRKMANGITTKYYILGLPVMKVSRKKI